MKKQTELYIPCFDCNQEGKNRGIKLVQKKGKYDFKNNPLNIETHYECAAGYNECARVDLYNKVSELQKKISEIEKTRNRKISHHQLPASLKAFTPISK